MQVVEEKKSQIDCSEGVSVPDECATQQIKYADDDQEADDQPATQIKPVQFFAFEEMTNIEEPEAELTDPLANQNQANQEIGFHLASSPNDEPYSVSPSFNEIAA